jgi:hypothetical protein
MPTPSLGRPPLHPPPPPTGTPNKVLEDAERNAFFNEKRRLTPEERKAILEKAALAGKIPEGIASGPRRAGRRKSRRRKSRKQSTRRR